MKPKDVKPGMRVRDSEGNLHRGPMRKPRQPASRYLSRAVFELAKGRDRLLAERTRCKAHTQIEGREHMTNSGKHTPGPWIAFDGSIRTEDTRIIMRSAPRNAYRPPLEEREANVRLIAAAPDLLDALRRMVLHAMGGGSTIEVRDAVVNQARAALAKAEGRDV